MAKKAKYHSRRFLNHKEGMAAMECMVDNRHGSVDGGVTITDCYRQTSLDFNVYNKKDAATVGAKLDNMIDELLAFRRSWRTHTNAFVKEEEKRNKEE